jgi:hypothetical protein
MLGNTEKDIPGKYEVMATCLDEANKLKILVWLFLRITR